MRPYFFVSLLALPFPLCAQWCDQGCFVSVPTDTSYPFSLAGDAIHVKGAHFRDHPAIEHEELHYSQIDAAFAYTHPINECYGLLFGAGYVGSRVDWKENPDFDETLFNYVNFSVGGFTKAYSDWLWSLVATMFIDTAHFHITDYALYQGILSGKYTWCDWLAFDAGFIVEVGLHKTKIWPILGFELAPWPNVWALSVVYPMDISFEWFLTSYLSLGGSVRFLRNRHRVSENEPLSHGIFEYRTAGAECDLSLQPFDWISVVGFAGSTFNGDLKITDANNHNATHFKFKGSFYAGVSALLNY